MDYRYGSHMVFQIEYHFVWVMKYRLLWARGYFYATVGQMTEEMIKQYLEHHFEPKPNDDFRMESE